MSGDVVPFSSRYLRPPDNLSEAAKRHFTDLVTTVPSGHFAPSDLPLLSRWAELCALCERAELELASTGPVLPDGKISTWFTVLTSTAKSLNGLALRLLQCAGLGKPLFVGEVGIKTSLVSSLLGRATLLDAKLSVQLAAGVVGILAWDWRDGAHGGSSLTGYEIGPSDPSLGVLGSH